MAIAYLPVSAQRVVRWITKEKPPLVGEQRDVNFQYFLHFLRCWGLCLKHMPCPYSWIIPGPEEGVAQCPGVWGVRDVRDSAALTSLRTPGLQTEELCLKPVVHRAWLLAPNLRGREWERRLVSKYILSPCSSLNGSTEQVAGLVQALPPLECVGLCECLFLCMEHPPLAWEPGRVTQSYGRKETVNRGSHRRVMPIAKVSLPRERFSIASQLLSAVVWQCHLRRTFTFPGLRLLGSLV